MSKAKSEPTTIPADDWRQHQLRRRAAGKGKHAMPHGRYSATKSTFRNGVTARPLSAAQARALWELCTLTVYHPDGFTVTPEMKAVCQHISDRVEPDAQWACIAQATAREHAYVAC